MTVEAKKELLKYKIINERYFHDVLTYKLLHYHYFDDVINQISEISLRNHIKFEVEKIDANQFIDLLELFIKVIKEHFFNITGIENIICSIIQNNIEMMNEYLTLDYKINDKDHIYILKDKIYKIIISNFIKNEKYIPMIFLVLTENNIDVKPINEYSFKESSDIINLLSDIVFCQRGRGKYIYLFYDIENNLKSFQIKRQNRKGKKYDAQTFQDKYISRYVKYYESIFKIYNNKSKYIKYFK